MFEKVYKFKVLFKWAFNHLKIRFLVIFLIFNIFTIIDILQGNAQWINLILINSALLLIYILVMMYMMYPKIDIRGQINNGKNWDVKVPIKAIRKHKLKKLNKIL
jgi:hypothetical protein